MQPDVRNNIIWANTGAVGLEQIHQLTIASNLVQGAASGSGNLNADPLFVNAAGGDYHLAANSPAKDAGVAVPLSVDFDQGSRPDNWSGVFDLGAYEIETVTDPGDSDGNGLPDAWELQYFGHLGVDPTADADGDGLSNAEEYASGTNPNNPDSDGDQVPDGQDQYPTDPHRSEDLPVQTYAAIDVSGDSTGGQDVTQVALDDDGKVAFGYPSGSGDNAQYCVRQWVNGSLSDPTSFNLRQVRVQTQGGQTYTLVDQLTPGLLLPDGQVYGNWSTQETDASGSGDTEVEPCGFLATDGSVQKLFTAEPFTLILNENGSGGTPGGAGISGGTGGYVGGTDFFSPHGSGAAGLGGANFVHSNLTGVTHYFMDGGILAPGLELTEDSDFAPLTVNKNGWAPGFHEHDPFLSACLWTGSALISLPGDEIYLKINDQNQVINVDENGDGYLWQPNADGTSGTSRLLQDLLPAKYQQQLKEIAPRLISNQDADGNVHILFDAQSLEGPAPGTWVARTFVLTVPQSGQNTGSSELEQIGLPESFDFQSSQINSAGVLSGTATADQTGNSGSTTATTKIAAVAIPARFMLRNDADVSKGWDSTGNLAGTDKSPCTAVSTSSPNQLVKLWLASGIDVSSLECVVDDSSPYSANCINLDAVTLKAGDNELKITGKTAVTIDPITGASTPAKIVLRDKLSKKISCALNVDVFEGQVAAVRIFFVSDSGNPDSTFSVPMQTLATSIETELENIFSSQALILFSELFSGTTTKTYDALYAPGAFDSDGRLSESGFSSIIALARSITGTHTLNIYVVKSLKGYGTLGATINSDSFVNYDAPIDVFAHEAGHALGLSRVKEAGTHDEGMHGWPVEFKTDGLPNPQQGLMKNPEGPNLSSWLREVDWAYANQVGCAKFH